MTVRPVYGAQPLPGMSIVERYRPWSIRDRRRRLDDSNNSGSCRGAEESASAQQSRHLHWLLPPNSPFDALASRNWSNKTDRVEFVLSGEDLPEIFSKGRSAPN